MKTKTAILLGLILVIIVDCGSAMVIKPHRSEFYEAKKTTGETTVELVGVFVGRDSTQGESLKLLRFYPECQDRATSQGDLFECVREIDIKEGRIKPEDMEKFERPNLDKIR